MHAVVKLLLSLLIVCIISDFCNVTKLGNLQRLHQCIEIDCCILQSLTLSLALLIHFALISFSSLFVLSEYSDVCSFIKYITASLDWFHDCRCIELCIFLCCLVLLVRYQEIGWEDYSRDIFRVEGFPPQRPDWRVVYCNGFILCIPDTNIFNCLVNLIL